VPVGEPGEVLPHLRWARGCPRCISLRRRGTPGTAPAATSPEKISTAFSAWPFSPAGTSGTLPGCSGAGCLTGRWRVTVITVGHRPLLIARSHKRRVTLRLVNRDVDNCHVEAVGVIAVSVTLPSAQGQRKLVQATTGEPIRYEQAP